MKTEEQSSLERPANLVAEALAYRRKAEELKDEAVRQLLETRAQIDRDLAELGYQPSVNGSVHQLPQPAPRVSADIGPKPRNRFKDMPLAQIAKVLLDEHGELHGKKIEELAIEGGFRSDMKNLQIYMPTALKRFGGFENIGKNTWRLNADIPPQRG